MVDGEWLDKPFSDAVRILRKMRPITKDEFATLAENERKHAFTISRVMKLATIQSYLDAINEAAQRGQWNEEWATEMSRQEYGVSDAMVAKTVAEHVQRAFGAGSWDHGTAA